MTKEIKTFDERKQSLLKLGKENGFITYDTIKLSLLDLEQYTKLQPLLEELENSHNKMGFKEFCIKEFFEFESAFFVPKL